MSGKDQTLAGLSNFKFNFLEGLMTQQCCGDRALLRKIPRSLWYRWEVGGQHVRPFSTGGESPTAPTVLSPAICLPSFQTRAQMPKVSPMPFDLSLYPSFIRSIHLPLNTFGWEAPTPTWEA